MMFCCFVSVRFARKSARCRVCKPGCRGRAGFGTPADPEQRDHEYELHGILYMLNQIRQFRTLFR